MTPLNPFQQYGKEHQEALEKVTESLVHHKMTSDEAAKFVNVIGGQQAETEEFLRTNKAPPFVTWNSLRGERPTDRITALIGIFLLNKKRGTPEFTGYDFNQKKFFQMMLFVENGEEKDLTDEDKEFFKEVKDVVSTIDYAQRKLNEAGGEKTAALKALQDQIDKLQQELELRKEMMNGLLEDYAEVVGEKTALQDKIEGELKPQIEALGKRVHKLCADLEAAKRAKDTDQSIIDALGDSLGAITKEFEDFEEAEEEIKRELEKRLSEERVAKEAAEEKARLADERGNMAEGQRDDAERRVETTTNWLNGAVERMNILGDQLAVLTRERDDLSALLATTEGNKEALEKEINEKLNPAIEAYRRALDQLRADFAAEESAKNRSYEEVARLNRRLQSLEEGLRVLKDEEEKIRYELEETRVQRDEEKEGRDRLRVAVGVARGRAQNAEIERDTLGDQRNAAYDYIAGEPDRIEAVKAVNQETIDGLKDDIKGLEQRIQGYQEVIRNLEQKVERSKSLADSAREDTLEVWGENKRIENRLAEARERIEELENQIRQNTEELDRLRVVKPEDPENAKKIGELTTANEALSVQLKELEGKMEGVAEELRRVSDERNRFNEENRELKSERRTLQEENRVFLRKSSDAQERLTATQKELEDAKEALRVKEIEVRDLERERQGVERAHQKEIHAKNTIIDRANAATDAAKKELAEKTAQFAGEKDRLTKGLDGERQRAEAAESALTIVKFENQSLKKQVEQKEAAREREETQRMRVELDLKNARLELAEKSGVVGPAMKEISRLEQVEKDLNKRVKELQDQITELEKRPPPLPPPPDKPIGPPPLPEKHWTDQIAKLTGELAAVKRDLEEAREAHQLTEAELARVNEEYSHAIGLHAKELGDLNREMQRNQQEAESRMTAAGERIAVLTKEIDRIDKFLEDALHEKSLSEAAKERLGKERDLLRADLADAHAWLSELATKNNTLSEALEDSEKWVRAILEKMREEKAKNFTSALGSATENKLLLEDLELFQLQAREAEQNAKRFEEEWMKVGGKLETAQHEKDELEKQIASMSQKGENTENLKKGLAAANQKMENAERRMGKMQEARAELQEENTRLAQEKTRLEQEVAKLTRQKDEAQSLAKAEANLRGDAVTAERRTGKKFRKVEKELEDVKTAAAEIVQDINEKRDRTDTENERLRTDLAHMIKRVADLLENLETKGTELETTKEEVRRKDETLKSTVREMTADLVAEKMKTQAKLSPQVPIEMDDAERLAFHRELDRTMGALKTAKIALFRSEVRGELLKEAIRRKVERKSNAVMEIAINQALDPSHQKYYRKHLDRKLNLNAKADIDWLAEYIGRNFFSWK